MRLCKNQVKLHGTFIRILYAFRKIARLARKLKQNPADFVTLAALQHFNIIVCINDGNRLYKHSCPRGRHIMHKTGHIYTVLGFYGHNKSAVSLSYNRLLQKFLVMSRVNHRIKLFAHGVCLGTHFSPDFKKLIRGLIRNFILGNNNGKDFIFKIFIYRNSLKKIIKCGAHSAAMAVPLIK